MDRQEWGEIVGDEGDVEDDLRWTLFSAERCILGMLEDFEERQERGPGVGTGRAKMDTKVFEAFKRQRIDAKYALAALWQREEQREARR